MFWQRPLNKYDVIENELNRLHKELGNFYFDGKQSSENDKPIMDAYLKVLDQVNLLNKSLIELDM